MNMGQRSDKAVELFKQGYNCSQAVFAAFADMYNIDQETALKLSSSFGGGMGRMREVCGTVSGMLMVVGMETGATEGKDAASKQHNYQVVQQMAEKFKQRNGSIICRELLGLDNTSHTETKPEDRTKEYYKKRPCVQLVEEAALMVEDFLEEQKKGKEEK